ncbi:30S ribosomal protein S2, partial [Candidatus Woesearchaeota archaeon]|nr:30S ribosomal protein S2 [Candidatus Woesearchaeota archaeon]
MAEEESFLVPTDVYFKAGVHIGTKFRTKYMQPFIYKIRTDGLAVLNVSQIDKRLRIAAKFLAQYAPEDVIIVCRRENGWKPLKLFGKYTGCKVFPGRYQPGILTNPKLAKFT